MFEVLTHGRDTILSFGVLGLIIGEWVIYTELLYQPSGKKTQLKESLSQTDINLQQQGEKIITCQ